MCTLLAGQECMSETKSNVAALQVKTRLPLPALDLTEPLLSVTADFPPSATAGQPFRCLWRELCLLTIVATW